MDDEDEIIEVRVVDEFDDLEAELDNDSNEIRVDSSDIREEASEVAIRAIHEGLEFGGGLPTVRRIAIVLIVAGSLLGLWFGVLSIAADPSDILGDNLQLESSDQTISGLIVTEILDDQSGGETPSGVEVRLLDESDVLINRSFTDQDGRFQFTNQPLEVRIIEVQSEGNITERRILVPGEVSQLTITLRSGSGTNEVDLRLESNLEDSVALGTVIAFFTVFSASLGFGSAMETLRGNSYRRAQWLAGLALFSRGGVFIGPGLILGGMALNRLAKQQFSDQSEPEE